MARVAVTISLSDDERAELEALVVARVAGACAAILDRLAAAEGSRTTRSPFVEASTVGKWRRRYAAPRRSVRRTPPRRAASNRLRHRGSGPADAGRVRDATHCLRSMARASTRPRPFIASGGPSACSRIARRPSDPFFVVSSTSSDCIWRRRIVPWFAVSTKRARSRPWSDATGRRSGAYDYKRHHDLSLAPSTSPREDHRQMFPAPSESSQTS